MIDEPTPAPVVNLIHANLPVIRASLAVARQMRAEPAVVILDPRMPLANRWARHHAAHMPAGHDFDHQCAVLTCADGAVIASLAELAGENATLKAATQSAAAQMADKRALARLIPGSALVVTITAGTVNFTVISDDKGEAPN